MPSSSLSLVTRDDVQRLRALLSPTFVTEVDDVLDRFAISLGFQHLAEVAAQFYASWISYRGLWADARDQYWEDLITRVCYENREDAPENRRNHIVFHLW